MASAVSGKIRERRNRVLLGPLPEDFLRLNISPQEQQEAADRQAAIALQQQYTVGAIPNAAGRLNITIVQAKLTKNYGMTRMDPYCRIRIAHSTYETPTDPNGGKNPRWNKVISCLHMVPQGIQTISIEIFDERSFTMDELIAWSLVTIPPKVLAGETDENWYKLSGKQGEDVEGMIFLVMTYSPAGPYVYQPYNQLMLVPRVDVGGPHGPPIKVFHRSPKAGDSLPPLELVLSETDLKQIEEMFPNLDKEVIKTVFEANRGNKDRTINSLLQMAD
ncbi:hypothetical protein HUJ04_010395 [Dendroctonus ponderosae]|nr:hypothetical protein HUJ04_010395 [Dendroctonus ponderosae]